MKHIQMMTVQMSLKVLTVGELTAWIAFIGLPIGTTLPPAITSRRICSIAIVISMLLSEVATDKILESMSHFMCHSMSSAR